MAGCITDGALHGRVLESCHCLAEGFYAYILRTYIPRFLTALQLLLTWRFFRLWALADGMEPVENMIRCMANNYSAAGFWRGWHRSYNQWLIRWARFDLVYLLLASDCGPEQVHIHPSWRTGKRDPSHDPCFYLCCSVARFDV